MRIMIETEKRIDEKAALINYYTLEKDMNNKNRKYCNKLMLVARRIIYTLSYKEYQISINNAIENKFRKILKLFLILGRYVLYS